MFVHKGSYQREYLVVENNVNILGCSSGNVAENVTIERDTESTVTFMEGARSSYLGYVTLKFSPDISSSVPHHKHYCLEIGENCSPVIDHCIIRSSSVGMFSSSFVLVIVLWVNLFFSECCSGRRCMCNRVWCGTHYPPLRHIRLRERWPLHHRPRSGSLWGQRNQPQRSGGHLGEKSRQSGYEKESYPSRPRRRHLHLRQRIRLFWE